MALNSRPAVDPRWTFHNSAIEKSLRLATIEIYNPDSTLSEYDPETNTWSGDTTLLWVGKARIQPRSSSARIGEAGNIIRAIDPGASQIVEVHIGLRENQLAGSEGVMPDLRPGHRMMVTESPLDPQLENFIFVVRSVINSSNPWHRALLCEVNQELNPNNA
jgi:hypothetical protein